MPSQNQYNAHDFMQKLEKGLFAHRFLFLGDEEGLKEKSTAKIYELLEKKFGKDCVALSHFHAESGDFEKFHEFILSPSMFTPAKLAVLTGLNSIQSTNENKSKFSDILTNIPPSSYIILHADGYNVPKAIPREHHDVIITVKFWRLFQNETEKYLMQSLNRLKIQYDQDALQQLIALLGNDVKKLDDALEKISFSGQSKITKDFIIDFIYRERDSNIFELLDCLLEKSMRSIQLIQSLLFDGVYELSILALITRNFENLMLFHKGIKEGKAPMEILNNLGIKEKNKQKFIGNADHFPPEIIKKIFVFIHEAEDKIKGGWQYKSSLSNPIIELAEKIIFST